MDFLTSDGTSMNDVTCCRMFDGRLSVRYNGAEVALLPNRLLMTPEDVERAVVAAIMAHDDGQIEVTAREAAQDAHDETIRALSGW